jgi:hypothetical protein
MLDELAGPVILPDRHFLWPTVLAGDNVHIPVVIQVKHVHAVGRVLPHHRV